MRAPHLLFLGLLFCTATASAQPFTLPGEDTLVTDSALTALFGQDEVTHANFGRKTLYTWTDSAQVAQLRAGMPLLLKKRSDEGELSLYDVELLRPKYDEYPAAKLLRNPSFERKRYAWCNPWATLSLFSRENYGDRLLEIVLEDSAYICGFFPGEKQPFAVRRADNSPVPVHEALEHPERWAAVYHVNVTNRRPWGVRKYEGTRTLRGKRFTRSYDSFREYVIINERMVKRWSYATPGVIDRLAQDLYKFSLLEKYFRQGEEARYFNMGYNGKAATQTWKGPAPARKMPDFFWASCAFARTWTIDQADAGWIREDLRLSLRAQQQGQLIVFPSRKYK